MARKPSTAALKALRAQQEAAFHALAPVTADEHAYYADLAQQQREEMAAENAWLRAAEYDPTYVGSEEETRDRYFS